MKSTEFITERAPTDSELRHRGWDGTPEYRDWFDVPIPNGRASTVFSVEDVFYDILGSENVLVDPDDDEDGNPDGWEPGKILVLSNADTAGSGNGRTELVGDTFEDGVIVHMKMDANSHNAVDIATAAHEAFHVRLAKGSRGAIYNNEQLVNKMAYKWLTQHLDGMALHAALSQINTSRISYRDQEL